MREGGLERLPFSSTSAPLDLSAQSERPLTEQGKREARPSAWPMVILLVAAACLLAFRLWHILADFPTYSFYSQDGARYTDEGFYLSAAIQHFTLGHAYVPGGWNPGIFMPVWPFLAGLVFHFTSVSVAAVRTLAVVCTWLSTLLAWAVTRQYRSRRFAAWTAFLVAANALGFFFGRLALLEPAFVMFMLLAIWLAGRVRPGNYALAGFVGVVFVVATLTKSSGPFLLAAVLFPIWAVNRGDRVARWKLTVTALAVAVVMLACIRFFWFARFPADAHIILGMDAPWMISHSLPRLTRFFFRGTWIDPVLFPLALVCFVAAISRLRWFWRDTLFTTTFLWEVGYAGFIVFHYDGPPRYFVVLIVPTIWMALIFTAWLWDRHRRTAMTVTAVIAISVAWNLAFIANYLVHPRYSMLDASVRIRQTIMTQTPQNPEESDLLIGRGADEVSLLSSGLPAIDSDGAMPLAEKLNVYNPGWFMDWTDFSSARRDTVTENRRAVQRAVFPDLDPFNGAGIVLYQLFPKSERPGKLPETIRE